MWLALPHDEEEWGSHFSEARVAVLELANAVAVSEPVHLLVSEEADTAGVDANVTCHIAPYGDIWLRDTGPLFVERDQAPGAVSFAFNGWGGKYVFPHDDEVAAHIARLANVPLQTSTLVAEGGAVDGNGVGTFLSTRECLLNANRNPGMDEAAVEQALAQAIGARKVIWLDKGLLGDHTDGHIDNLARFVARATVVCMAPQPGGDPNAEVLIDVRRTLESARTADGEALEIVTLPSPGRVEGPSGVMAASYCNFLIANTCVVVPAFGVPADAEARAILGKLFPTRRIVGLDAYALCTGGGTVHCISQQEPQHLAKEASI